MAEFKSELEKLANTLPQAKLEELRAIILRSLKRRFRAPKEPKYGSLHC
ncbi:MAG: hypothetical protein QXF82_08025 [Nitrososphaeria archaeon]